MISSQCCKDLKHSDLLLQLILRLINEFVLGFEHYAPEISLTLNDSK